MELVANVWPVVDATTGIVHRYLMRAYAMEADDAVIERTLKALAPSDFRMARAFQIPDHFILQGPPGKQISRVVPIALFHDQLQQIVTDAYAELEKDAATLQGVDMTGGTPKHARVLAKFPENPYTVTTVLLENQKGELMPQLQGKR